MIYFITASTDGERFNLFEFFELSPSLGPAPPKLITELAFLEPYLDQLRFC